MVTVETSDPTEAGAALERGFPGVHLTGAADGSAFQVVHSWAREGLMSYTRLGVHGSLDMTGLYPNQFAIGRRYRGTVGIQYGLDRINTEGAFLRPYGESTAHFEDSDAELIILDPAGFADAAALHLEGTGRRFRTPDPRAAAPLSPTGARLWNSTADVFISTLTESPSELRTSFLLDLTVAAALIAFPMTEAVAAPSGVQVLPRALRKATDYIDEHLADPITVAMIAESARVSVRTLQDGFRRHLDATPVQYIRRARLDAARRELQQNEPGEVTVAAVAERWGFTHLARFAANYRAAYGENPSETLRS